MRQFPKQAIRRRYLALLVAIIMSYSLGAVFFLRHGHFPLFDSHPRLLGNVGMMAYAGKTEADFEAAFGCRGKLIKGSRTSEKARTVEWSDDTMCFQVSFDENGKWIRIRWGPFFGIGGTYSHSERLMVWLRSIGLNIR